MIYGCNTNASTNDNTSNTNLGVCFGIQGLGRTGYCSSILGKYDNTHNSLVAHEDTRTTPDSIWFCIGGEDGVIILYSMKHCIDKDTTTTTNKSTNFTSVPTSVAYSKKQVINIPNNISYVYYPNPNPIPNLSKQVINIPNSTPVRCMTHIPCANGILTITLTLT